MKRYKVLVSKNTFTFVNTDLLSHGIYSKEVPTLYDEDLTIELLREQVISYFRQTVPQGDFQVIKCKITENFNHLELLTIEIERPSNDLVQEIFMCISENFSIPFYDKPSFNRLLMIKNNKVYISEDKNNWTKVELNPDFVRVNKNLFQRL